MTRFTSIVLVAGLAATPALAQDTMDMSDLIRSRDITGGTVYTTNTAMDDNDWGVMPDAVDAGWNDIGEIEDIVLDRNGQMRGIVAEVGGFLDIADKHVFLPVEDVHLTPVDDKEYAILTRFSEEELEQRQTVDEGWWD